MAFQFAVPADNVSPSFLGEIDFSAVAAANKPFVHVVPELVTPHEK
jgi:hypothetical protein